MSISFKKGIISVGLIVFALVGLTAFVSAGVMARHREDGRSVSKRFCRFSPNSSRCQNKKGSADSDKKSRSTSYAPSPKGPCYPLGDANMDTVLNDYDAQVILSYSVGERQTNFSAQNADVNGDGKTDSVDATLIRQYLSSITRKFPACNAVSSTNPPPSPVVKKPPCGFYGDPNRDTVVNNTDADLILKYVAGTYTFVGTGKTWADVNKDNTVNAVDAQLIKSYVAGSISTFPACSTP